MITKTTIVMYHYVRELNDTRYPAIKALNTSAFIRQLEYFGKHYTFISADQLLNSIETGVELPDNAIHLTFDDGYLDHYTNVFPLLVRYGISASFFPPSRSVLNRKILDVNKIHLILAASSSITETVRATKDLITKLSKDRELKTAEEYYYEFAKPSMYDDADTMFVKKMLQRELPEAVREIIVNSLYDSIVGVTENIMAEELYLTLNQLQVMYKNGMTIGSHSYNHYHMDTLAPEEQRTEVQRSLELLNAIDKAMKVKSLCYPYGGYNDSLTGILQEEGFGLAYAIKNTVAEITKQNRFCLQRFDTNEFPK